MPEKISARQKNKTLVFMFCGLVLKDKSKKYLGNERISWREVAWQIIR